MRATPKLNLRNFAANLVVCRLQMELECSNRAIDQSTAPLSHRLAWSLAGTSGHNMEAQKCGKSMMFPAVARSLGVSESQARAAIDFLGKEIDRVARGVRVVRADQLDAVRAAHEAAVRRGQNSRKKEAAPKHWRARGRGGSNG